MPTYEYVCTKGHKFDRVLKVADCQKPQKCECGSKGKKIISAPMVFVSPEIRYTSPIDGKVIATRQQRQDDLARNNCIPYDPGMKQDADRRQRESEMKLEKSLDATVEKQIHDMPSRKREKLVAELQGGVTAEYARSTIGN
jgi:putative FmdB family regulatory protein